VALVKSSTVGMVRCSPADLSAALVERYLAVKRDGLL
jgi:hypothetical protein